MKTISISGYLFNSISKISINIILIITILNLILLRNSKPLEFDLHLKDVLQKNDLTNQPKKNYLISKKAFDNANINITTVNEKNFLSSKFSKKQNEENHYLLHGAKLIDLVGLKDGLYTIKIGLGNPTQYFDVIIDSGSFLLWIPSDDCSNCYFSDNKFITKNSGTFFKTSQSYNLNYISGKVSGKVSKDGISLNDGLLIPNFKFLLSDYVDAPVKVDGIIGFARKYSNYPDDFSIMEQLYKNKIIEKKIYSQKIVKNENSENKINSKFYIGDLAEEILNDFKNYSTCKAVNFPYSVSSFWTCNLKSLYFKSFITEKGIKTEKYINADKKEIKKILPAIFDTGSNVILAPLHYAESFRDNYFAEAIKQKKCISIEDYTGNLGFECEEDIDFEKDFPKILFKFENGKIYEISNKFIFNLENDKYIFKIIFAYVPGNGWLLGQPFLKSFHMVFDYQNDTIGFYSNNPGNNIPFSEKNGVNKKEVDLEGVFYDSIKKVENLRINRKFSENINLLYYFLGFLGIFSVFIKIIYLFKNYFGKFNLLTDLKKEGKGNINILNILKI